MNRLKSVCLVFAIVLVKSTDAVQYFSENDIPELPYLDTSVNPCDDFYKFTCGNFAKFNPRPDNQNVIDHFTILEDQLVHLGKEILSAPNHPNDPTSVKKAKTAYKACTNLQLYTNTYSPEMSTVEEVGGMPIISPSNQTSNFSWNEIGQLVAKYGIPLIFAYNIVQINPNQSAILVTSDPLNNPTLFRPKFARSYDRVLEEAFQELAERKVRDLAPFDVFLRSVVNNLLKYTYPEKPEEEVVQELDEMASFMRGMYAGGIPTEHVPPLDAEVTLKELQEWTDQQFSGTINLNWITYLNNIFKPSGVTVTEETKFMHRNMHERINGVLNLVKQTSPDVIKNFVLLRIFLFQAPDSDEVSRKAFEDYYKAKGYQLFPRWEYCARKILDVVDTASLSYAVAYDYQRYYYNINKLSKANKLIGNLQDAFKNLLLDNDWMDQQSRKLALEKLEKTLILLGFPDFSSESNSLDEFYQNFRVCVKDNYGNSRRIRAFKQAYQFTQLGKPNRSFWGKSPFDPNAYYNRPNNKIVVPISMLNPVFFNGDNPILDYSRIGSIIGHELTHGFDVFGKNYNQDGAQEPWWSNNTLEKFSQRAQCFIEQYSKYYVQEIDTYVNGSYCINENLADNGGVRESYNAFKKLLQENDYQASGQYTLEQLFFIGYGTMWCGDESLSALKTLVSTVEGYPPKKFRVIGSLSNMEEFSEAFGCPIGSNMNPESKCILW